MGFHERYIPEGPETQEALEAAKNTRVPEHIATAEKAAEEAEVTQAQCEAVDARCALVAQQHGVEEIPEDPRAEQETAQLNRKYSLALQNIEDQLQNLLAGNKPMPQEKEEVPPVANIAAIEVATPETPPGDTQSVFA